MKTPEEVVRYYKIFRKEAQPNASADTTDRNIEIYLRNRRDNHKLRDIAAEYGISAARAGQICQVVEYKAQLALERYNALA